MTAVRAAPSDLTGLWQTLAAPAREGGPDVWGALDDHLDLGAYVPIPSPDVEERAVKGRGDRAFWVLRSPSFHYLRLDETDLDLWRRMDGRSTVRQIALDHFLERGGFVADRLARLVRRLRADGFLGPPPLDAFEAAGDRLRGRSRLARWLGLAGRLLEIDLWQLKRADQAFSWAYDHGGWLLYVRPARVLWLLIIVAGLGTWWHQVLIAEHDLLQTNGSYTLGLLTLAVMEFVGIALYQVAQGLRMKRHDVRITAAGLQLSYFLPVLYVETSDVWLAHRRARMAVSLSGPFAVLVLGGLLALLAYPLDGTEMGAFLFKASFVWLVNGIFNLLPILDLDGYFLLVDYFEMPALRANSLAFVRDGLWPRLRARVPLSRDEWVYTAYGLGYALLVAVIPMLILGARDLRYASSFSELWRRSDPGGPLLAVGMAAFLLGPAVAAIVGRIGQAMVAVGLLVHRRWKRSRGDIPREQIEALAGLPFLAGIPRGELRAVGAHLRAEEAEAGKLIVRQGARGDRFFVILEGQVRVVRITAHEHEEQLATLGPGDYFGEAALVANVPRTATVIAELPTRLLSLDAGHFRRWLAERVDVDEAVHRSMAERHRLTALPLFAGIGSAELDRLAARMLVTRYSAGDVIVEQGAEGDRFFVIVDGRVEVVYLGDDGEPRVLAELAEGDYFGEMALIDRAPRSATVRALSPVETYTLTAADFQYLLDRPASSEHVRATARQRATQNAARPSS